MHISKDLDCTHSSSDENAWQWMHCLRQLRKFSVSSAILENFRYRGYRSILTQCMSVWNCSTQDHRVLEWVVRLAEWITGSAHSSLHDINTRRWCNRATKIIRDVCNCLFNLLPLGKQFCSLMAETERFRRRSFWQLHRTLMLSDFFIQWHLESLHMRHSTL